MAILVFSSRVLKSMSKVAIWLNLSNFCFSVSVVEVFGNLGWVDLNK